VHDTNQRFDFSQFQLARDFQDNSTALVSANYHRELAIRSHQTQKTSSGRSKSQPESHGKNEANDLP
jgi:hypothetical protein